MTRLDEAIAAIDELNADDPRRVEVDGALIAEELVYGRRMSAVLDRLYPDASELLKLAVRAQHLRRWTIPRSAYPLDRAGYHRWRNELKRMHGALAAEVLGRTGYTDAEAARVRSLIEKRDLKHDPDAQALEDVACIVFLTFHADAFAARYAEDKMIGILRKTWAKMSPHGQRAALGLELSARLRQLVATALQPGSASV